MAEIHAASESFDSKAELSFKYLQVRIVTMPTHLLTSVLSTVVLWLCLSTISKSSQHHDWHEHYWFGKRGVSIRVGYWDIVNSLMMLFQDYLRHF